MINLNNIVYITSGIAKQYEWDIFIYKITRSFYKKINLEKLFININELKNIFSIFYVSLNFFLEEQKEKGVRNMRE